MKKVCMLLCLILLALCNTVFAYDDNWIDAPIVKGVSCSMPLMEVVNKLGGEKAIIAVDSSGTYQVASRLYMAPGFALKVSNILGTDKIEKKQNCGFIIKNPDIRLDNYNVGIGDSIDEITLNLGRRGEYRQYSDMSKYIYRFDYIHPFYNRRKTGIITFWLDRNNVCNKIDIFR